MKSTRGDNARLAEAYRSRPKSWITGRGDTRMQTDRKVAQRAKRRARRSAHGLGIQMQTVDVKVLQNQSTIFEIVDAILQVAWSESVARGLNKTLYDGLQAPANFETSSSRIVVTCGHHLSTPTTSTNMQIHHICTSQEYHLLNPCSVDSCRRRQPQSKSDYNC